MFDPTAKKLLLASLVACFALQTALVYTDDVDLTLSREAVRGRQVFHEQNCQVCHQLWGQGGFLGPDLTNAAGRVDKARLDLLLTSGSGQMPAMHVPQADIDAVWAFLGELNRAELGNGQLRLGLAGEGTSPQAAFEAAVTAAGPPPDAAAGFERFRSGICTTCHFPFQVSLVNAPDLSTVVARLDDPQILGVLTGGRPERGMPPPGPPLSEVDLAHVLTFFHWLNENRAALLADSEERRSARSVDWSRLSWWEFR